MLNGQSGPYSSPSFVGGHMDESRVTMHTMWAAYPEKDETPIHTVSTSILCGLADKGKVTYAWPHARVCP